MTEHDIQNAIRLKLSEMGYFTERINVGAGYLIPAELMENLRHAQLAPKLKAALSKIPYFSTGAVKGRSDLSAVKDGRICYIEVKTGTGKASPEQLRFIAVMRDKYGCCAGIARSVEEAVRIVTGTDRDTCNE